MGSISSWGLRRKRRGRGRWGCIRSSRGGRGTYLQGYGLSLSALDFIASDVRRRIYRVISGDDLGRCTIERMLVRGSNHA